MRRAVLALVLIAACNDEHGPYGTLGNTCYDTGVCNPGLVCVDQTCVAEPPPPDAGWWPDAWAVDASPAVACDSDLAIEPNDSFVQAFITPIPAVSSCVSLVSLALCPVEDVDLYRFSVDTTGKNIRAVARHESGIVVLRLLNASGTVIANETVEAVGTVSVTVNNLAVGTYYIHAALAAPGAVTNYDLDVFQCDEADCAATTTCP